MLPGFPEANEWILKILNSARQFFHKAQFYLLFMPFYF
jgi:hypothetical protein